MFYKKQKIGGKWYPRSFTAGTYDTEDVAERLSEMSTVSKGGHLCRAHGAGRGAGQHDGAGQLGEARRAGHVLPGGKRQRAGRGHARRGQSRAVPQGDGGFYTRVQPGAEPSGREKDHCARKGRMDRNEWDVKEVTSYKN